MITYSIIQKSQLEGAHRLDAEYYQPEYLEVDNRILNFGKFYYFGDLITKFNSGKNWPQKIMGTVKFIKTQHIKDILIRDEDDLTFCDGQPPKNSLLNEGDLLFVRVGGVSDNSVAPKDYNDHFYSDNVLRIRIKNLNPFFVSVFLNSYYGKSQLEKVMKGVAQPLISRENFEKLKIPEPSLEFQKEMENYVLEAYNFKNKSLILYSQAEELLLEELGLSSFAEASEDKKDLYYIVNLSEIKSSHRADAEYFQPKYEKLISKIKKQKAKTLESFVKNYSTGFPFKSENYQEQGIPLIRINNIKKGYLDLSDTAYLTKKDYLLSPKDVSKPGDIVLSMSGTTGMSALISEDVPNCSINQRILRITTKDIDKNYLTLLLNSIVGLYQLERVGTGGVQTNISYKDIKNVLIPVLPKSTQDKISELVKQSYQARKTAKLLLEEAKKKVENIIETHPATPHQKLRFSTGQENRGFGPKIPPSPLKSKTAFSQGKK